MTLLRSLSIACVVLASACTSPVSVPPAPRLTLAQLDDGGAISRAGFAKLRRAAVADFREELTISIREGISGRGFEGRGVLAVRPGHALRMILLGPGGTTAMDVWMRDGRFRVAIPALDRVVRGDETTPRAKMRGLPIDMLARWLVSPFGGTFVAAHEGRVDPEGGVAAFDSTGPAPTRSFVAFHLRGSALEARERSISSTGIKGRAWWLEHGRLRAFLTGTERTLGSGEEAPIAATDTRFISLDPPMQVEVHVDGVSLVKADAPLPEATFVEPE